MYAMYVCMHNHPVASGSTQHVCMQHVCMLCMHVCMHVRSAALSILCWCEKEPAEIFLSISRAIVWRQKQPEPQKEKKSPERFEIWLFENTEAGPSLAAEAGICLFKRRKVWPSALRHFWALLAICVYICIYIYIYIYMYTCTVVTNTVCMYIQSYIHTHLFYTYTYTRIPDE